MVMATPAGLLILLAVALGRRRSALAQGRRVAARPRSGDGGLA
jgi:hypothetical protein